MKRLSRLPAVVLLIAALAAPVAPAAAAGGFTFTPTSASFSEDVNSPGTGWQFTSSPAPAWFPAGWTNAYTYTNGGSCLKVTASGFTGSPTWNAYYTTTNISTSQVNVALAGRTSTCSAPTAAGTPISSNSSSATPLTGNSGNNTYYYYVVVQPLVAISSSATINVNFKIQSTIGTFPITMNPGQAIAVTITPSSGATFAEDVINPGTGWSFNTSKPWFPTVSGWTNSAYTFTNSSTCLTVKVTTSVQNWNLSASYSASPTPSKPINVALAQAGTGSTCSAPVSAGTQLSGSPATVLSNQSGTQTADYYVVVQPTLAVTSNVTLTTTFTAQ